MRLIFGFLVLWLCAQSVVGVAQSNTLKLTPLPNATQFTYRWQYKNSPQTLTFAIPNTDLQRGQNEFQRFDNTKAQAFALKGAALKAQEVSTNGLTVRVQAHPNAYQISISSHPLIPPSAAVISATQTAVQHAYDEAMQQYIFNSFYLNYNQRYIMPDHKRIAARYAQALRPMVQSIALQTQQMSARERIDWILAFLQSIPYDTLLNRQTSNGSGFTTPYGLLRTNKGDCDTKSVTFLAILRGLYPKLPLTMVYVPEHAFVGVGLPQGPNDYALKLGKQTYILADPTGPAILKLGEADTRALNLLKRKDYSYQTVPI